MPEEPPQKAERKIDKSTSVSIGILVVAMVAVLAIWERLSALDKRTAVIDERFASLENVVVTGFKEVKHTLERQGDGARQHAIDVVRIEARIEALEKRLLELERAK